MPGPEMDLKKELFDAGNRLLKPPSSVDDLLTLLDRVEHCLSFVEQQPPVEMQDALCPAFKALVTKELLKHEDNDVRVGVAACLTEISRITAPDVPYGDQLMKEVFKLTISAFEGLSDKSSKSFGKRVSILETVARVRLCAVLLDLDCDDLVVEMFQNFYKCIRDFHTANVFASMESIMTLVIEEYDDISADLLFALLSVLKREKQDASPVPKRLGEKVVQNCAIKLKSCIVEAIKSLKIDLIDYDFVVTLACQTETNHDPFREVNCDVPLVNGNDSPVKVVGKEAVPILSPHVPPIGNTVIMEEAGEDDDATQRMLNTLHELDSNGVACASKTTQDQVHVGPGAINVINDMSMNLEPVPLLKSEPKFKEIPKKRGRKPLNVNDITETDLSKFPHPDGNKQASESRVSEANVEVLNAHTHDSSMDRSAPEKNYDSSNQLSPNTVENNVVDHDSPSGINIPAEKSSSELIRRSEEPVLVQEATPSHLNSEKKAFNMPNDSDALHLSLEKVVPDKVGDASNFVSPVEVKNEQDTEGDSQLGITDGTQKSKKRGRPRKDASMPAVAGVKGEVSLEGTSQKRSRVMFTFPEEGKEYREDLIGTRIRIWWPADREYYEGIVKAYDPIKRRHTILYTDNEIESLRLHKQKWQLLKSNIGSGKVTSHTNAGDASAKQEGVKMKSDSSSAGTMGNTDSPLKRRPGRPPKKHVAPLSYDSPVKGSMLDGETKLNEKQNNSVADDGNLLKSMDSVFQCTDVPIMNSENTEHDVPPENRGTLSKQDVAMGTCVTDTMAPKAPVRFYINDPFTYRSDEEADPSETVTPKTENPNVCATKEVKPGSAEVPRIAGLNLKFPAFGTGMSSTKRKPRTNSISNSPVITGSADTVTKKHRGRPPYKFLLQNSIEGSKDISSQSGDPKVNESTSVDRLVNVAVVDSKGSLDGSFNATYIGAEHSVTAPDSMTMRMGTTEVAGPAQTSSKTVSEQLKLGSLRGPTEVAGPATSSKTVPEQLKLGSSRGPTEVAGPATSSKTVPEQLKLGSLTGLKIKFKTSVPEPMICRRLSRKTVSSPSDHLNKDGSAKRPRGRPPFRTKDSELKLAREAEGNFSSRSDKIKPDSESIDEAYISPLSKNDTPNVNVTMPADICVEDKKDTSEVADSSSNIGNISITKEAWIQN